MIGQKREMRTSLEEADDEMEWKRGTELHVEGGVGAQEVGALDDSVVRSANSTSAIKRREQTYFKETSTLFDKEGTQVTPKVDSIFTFDDTMR